MKLSVDAINDQSPFWVIQLDDMLFRFITKNGIKGSEGQSHFFSLHNNYVMAGVHLFTSAIAVFLPPFVIDNIAIGIFFGKYLEVIEK